MQHGHAAANAAGAAGRFSGCSQPGTCKCVSAVGMGSNIHWLIQQACEKGSVHTSKLSRSRHRRPRCQSLRHSRMTQSGPRGCGSRCRGGCGCGGGCSCGCGGGCSLRGRHCWPARRSALAGRQAGCWKRRWLRGGTCQRVHSWRLPACGAGRSLAPGRLGPRGCGALQGGGGDQTACRHGLAWAVWPEGCLLGHSMTEA